MNDQYYELIEEMHSFYEKDDPTEEDQIIFENAMKKLIEETPEKDCTQAFAYNLAMHYMNVKKFELAKEYFEIGAKTGDWTCKQGLGIIWYYGLCGEQDFEKAYMYFENRKFGRSAYLLAEMYHFGNYVERDDVKCRQILEELFEKAIAERYSGKHDLSTLYPEVAVRLVWQNIEEEQVTLFDLDILYSAWKILAIRQKHNPSWINLSSMRDVVETLAYMEGKKYRFKDIYDLMVIDFSNAVVVFSYNDASYHIDIFKDNERIIFQFQDELYDGADDFLEYARIDRKRITSIYDDITHVMIDAE